MRADAATAFSRTTLRVIVPAIAVSGLVALAAELLGDPAGPPASGTGAASRSALGHGAFALLLERSGHPVAVTRLPASPRPGALLVMAEPEPGAADGTLERLRDQLEGWERALLVLPKRAGQPDQERPEWIASATLLGEALVNGQLEGLGIDARVVRPDDATLAWSGPHGLLPGLSRPQLVEGPDLVPVIECERGILLGRLADDDGTDRLRYVLADPDLLANHGLGRGDNAALVMAIVGDLVAEGTPILIDETLHGGVRAAGLWGTLRRFPHALVVVQALLTLGVLLLASTRRFGPPEPAPEELARSKTTLLDHSARLLISGRHERAMLQRYLRQALHEVAEARRLTSEADPGERTEHLARLSARTGTADDPRDLVEAVAALDERASAAAFRTLRLARRIHTWREEMTYGPGPNP